MLEAIGIMRRFRQFGFTLIELMIVVALVAILLALVAPSFQETIARNKLEGVAGEFSTDLQYARSEAVSRNANVRLTVGSAGTCYTVHLASLACNCQNSPVCTGGVEPIKNVSIAGTGVIATSPGPIEFEPVRGSVTTGDSQVTLQSLVGGASLRAEVLAVGRVKICSPVGSFKGYQAC